MTRNAFGDAGAGRSSAVEQDLVEHFASHRQSAVGVSCETRAGATKSPAMTRPFGARTRTPDSAAAPEHFDALERAHRVEHARRLGAEVLGARFRSRESRAVDEQHVNAAPSQREGERRSRRTTADDEDVGVHADRREERHEDRRGGRAARRFR